ncbi:hypothetical protein RAAC3_TM7C00001G0194 [Candidatus Saccharibacteria bacterium RAAC3_TM7_1]|nr:hypothetical protein RAAC3_TM7C00001G0194 [Candidatus Saccharibacteria bacterium RAAC3_TM7_1]HCZ28768.1 hypothetical protein [Candidatus Saccharibacteria bacterium]
MVTIAGIVDKYQTFPITKIPSNVPYAVRKHSVSDAKLRREALEDFMYSSQRWPRLEFPQLESETLHQYIYSLVNLLEDVEYVEGSEEEKDHIFEVIESKLMELNRHQKIRRMMAETAIDSAEVLRQEAGDVTFEIFGQLDPDRFAYYFSQDYTRARTWTRNSAITGRKRAVATQFLQRTQDVKVPVDFEFETLDPETMEMFKGDLTVILPGLEKFLAQEIPASVPVDRVLPYFDNALDAVSLSGKGWRSRFTEGKQAEENHAHRTIDVGRNRPPFTGARLKPLPLHEATHCLRANNADEQPNAAHRLPSKTNLAFEEGLCKAIESIITGKDTQAGSAYYVSLGLQLGLDIGGERRDFRETFEIMWPRQAMISGAETAKDIREAKVSAYQTMLRTTRGNAVDARDKSYSDGDQLSKSWLNSIKALPEEQRREKLRWVLSAQFNPMDPEAAELFKDISLRV